MTKLVLHFRNQALIHPIENLAELMKRLWMGFAYTEVLGDSTYHHYDVFAVKRHRQKD